MMITDELRAKCHECGEETEWEITHRIVNYHGIVHCLKCRECGKVVPYFAFERYQATGKVVIPV